MTERPGFDEDNVVDLAQSDPPGVITQATALLSLEDSSSKEVAVALWARGLAHRELDALDEAESDLRAARDLASSVDRRLRERIGVTLALVVMYQGESEQALEILRSCEKHLFGAERGRMLLQRGLVRHRMGDLGAARNDYSAAASELRDVDPVSVVRVLINLAVLDVYEGCPHDAIPRLVEALDAADGADQPLLAAFAEHNLGYAFAGIGDVVASLQHYGRADDRYQTIEDSEGRQAVVAADRSAILLTAHLLAEADDESERALAVLRDLGESPDLAETALLAARVRLALGDTERADAALALAHSSFVAAGRDAWLPIVELCSVQRSAMAGGAPGLAMRAESVARALLDHRWLGEARAALLLAGRLHLEDGARDDARRVLRELSRSTSSESPYERASGQLARGLMALVDGDRAGARRAVTIGSRLLWDGRVGIGHCEVRAHAAAHGEELGLLGIRLAVEDRRSREFLRRIEDSRRISSVGPTVRPPDDPQTAQALIDLRWVMRQLRDTVSEHEHADLVGRQRRLEKLVAGRSRLGTETQGGPPVADFDAALKSLGQCAALEFGELDGDLWVGSIVKNRSALAGLGDVASVHAHVDGANLAINRLQRNRQSEASFHASRALLAESGIRLGRLLPAVVMHSDAPLVIVPSASLEGVPWRCVPLLAQRSFCVAPSLSSWNMAELRRSRRRTGRMRVLVVDGPGLEHARREVDLVAAAHSGSGEVAVQAGSIAELLNQLEEADVVHLACHGKFRRDNPLFSSLQLRDGDLSFYDLEQCAQLPHTIVMSACNAGQNAVLRGGALLGMTSALIQLGVSSVIAPLTPVNDERSVDLMVRLHNHLAAGVPAAEALAKASFGPDGALDPTAAPFVCFGS